MLFNLIISGFLLVINQCLDNLTLSVSHTNNKQYQLGTFDTNEIIIFNPEKNRSI